MNSIAFLEKHIDKANAIAKEYRTILSNDPNNISYKLSLITIEGHIADLQMQLKREKEKKRKRD